jgi:hypothetical protein
MAKIEREYSSMEYAVKSLLEAANTEGWRDVLNILYLSGSVTAFSEELQLPCLVSAKGPYEKIEHSIDLLRGKAEVAITPLIKELAKMILPRIIVILQRSKITTVIKEERQEMLGIIVATELIPELEKYQKELARIIVQGASTLSDLIIVGVLRSLLEIRNNHIHSALNEDKYEDMIEGLRKFGLIESRLQVSLCPECANYQFAISRYPSLIEDCPKCGTRWVTVILYSLQPPYSETKIDNSDLPLFISSYLKHKIASQAPVGEVKVFPKALIKSNETIVCDVDVYLPEFAIGVECKVFEDPFARMTQSRLGSIVGKLLPEIKKHFDIGIKSLIIVTNLSESAGNKLKTALEKALKEEGLNQPIEVLPGNIDTLMKWINEQASKIAKQVQESINKAIEQALEKTQKRELTEGQILESKK